MLTITVRDLINPLLQDATRRLYACTGFKSVTESYAVGRLCKALDQELQAVQAEWRKLVEKYARKDANGEIAYVEGGQPGQFMVPDELSAEFQKAVDEFHDIEIKVDSQGLTGKMLDAVQLSPAHLDAIECLKVVQPALKAVPDKKVKKYSRQPVKDQTSERTF